MLRIIADERERRSGVPEVLRSLGAAVEYRVLDVADYLIGNYAVERKSVRDFFSSLYSGRLFDQAHRIGEAYQTNFLIVEGNLWRDPSEIKNSRSLWGALISAVLDFELNTFFSPNTEETAQFLYTLGTGGRHKKGSGPPPVVVRKPKTADTRRIQVSILSSLPGVGPQMAEQMLSHFGSLRKVFAASVTDLAVGAKLSRARALNIVKLLETGYKGSKTERTQTSLSQDR
jgi:DNA excision repair protein ERCC-4